MRDPQQHLLTGRIVAVHFKLPLMSDKGAHPILQSEAQRSREHRWRVSPGRLGTALSHSMAAADREQTPSQGCESCHGLGKTEFSSGSGPNDIQARRRPSHLFRSYLAGAEVAHHLAAERNRFRLDGFSEKSILTMQVDIWVPPSPRCLPVL